MHDAILVIGAAGFIGRAITAALIDSGATVTGLTRHPVARPVPGVDYHINDLSQSESLDVVLSRCKWVVYAATSSTPGSSAGQPLAEIDQHLRPLAVLLEALQRQPRTSLCYISSAGAIYGSSNHTTFSEEHATSPLSYHGATKVAAETYIKSWTDQFSTNATVVRPTNVYGPGQPAHAGFGIIPAVLQCLKTGDTLNVWGDGSAVRDYLYIDDFVELILATIDQRSDIKGCTVLNAASGEALPVNEVLALAEEVARIKLQRRYTAPRRVDADIVQVDAQKSRTTLGWNPAHTLAEGLMETWQWFNTDQR